MYIVIRVGINTGAGGTGDQYSVLPLRYLSRSGEGGGGLGGGGHSLYKCIRGCAAGMGVMFSHLLVFIEVINSRF